MTKKAAADRKSRLRLIFQISVLVLAVGVLLPQFNRFRGFSHAIGQIDPSWFAAALVFTVFNYVFAAATYVCLAPHRLRFGRTMLIQIATSFANRLLPVGIGAMSINERYLERSARLRPAQAVSLVSANQLVGFVAYSAIWTVLIAGFAVVPPQLHFHIFYVWIGAAALLLGVFFRLFFGHLFGRIALFLRHTLRALYELARRPLHLLLAIVSSAGITLSYAMAFYLCTLAAGMHISYVHALLICLGGFAVNAVSPTPGGLGALEATLVAALVGSHVPGPQALVAVLGYRLATFWLPILPGYALFQLAAHRRWF